MFKWCLISLLVLDPVENGWASWQRLEAKNFDFPVV